MILLQSLMWDFAAHQLTNKLQRFVLQFIG